MNKVILTGNLTRDIEVRESQNKNNAVSNCVAVKRDFKNAAGTYDTDFINFVAWGNTAQYLANHAKKGDRVEIVGRWQVRSYEDANGVKKLINEVVVESIWVFMTKDKEEKPVDQVLVNDIEDNLPF